MIGKPSLDEWLGGLKHITADSHARADYQLALGAGRFAPEFHENPNTPVWRFGKLVKDDIDDFGAVIENHRLVNNLSSFNGRFLFIYGELEKLSLPGYSTIEMSYYTHATSVAVPGVGHDGAWERADTISAIIRVFLK
jgi:pimeloyl-ACP methyl ester carboxylesterase